MNLIEMLMGANPIKNRDDLSNSYNALVGTIQNKIGMNKPTLQKQLTEEELLDLIRRYQDSLNAKISQ